MASRAPARLFHTLRWANPNAYKKNPQRATFIAQQVRHDVANLAAQILVMPISQSGKVNACSCGMYYMLCNPVMHSIIFLFFLHRSAVSHNIGDLLSSLVDKLSCLYIVPNWKKWNKEEVLLTNHVG